MNRSLSVSLQVVLIAAVMLPLLLGGQVRQLLPEEPVPPDSFPFREGEGVTYEVYWKPWFLLPSVKAGEIRLSLSREPYEGKDAFKISAWAVSGGAFRSVMGLDIRDYFESTMDSENLRSYRYRHKARQGRRQRDLEVTVDYQKRQLTVQEYDVSADPPRRVRHQTHHRVPALITDTLSVFYAARLHALRPGDQYLIHLSDNGRIQDVQLDVIKRQRLSIDLGEFETIKISTSGGFFRGAGDFHIWYTLDPLRIPVRFEADVRFGKVYGDLIRLQTPQLVKGRVRTK